MDGAQASRGAVAPYPTHQVRVVGYRSGPVGRQASEKRIGRQPCGSRSLFYDTDLVCGIIKGSFCPAKLVAPSILAFHLVLCPWIVREELVL